MALVFQSSVMNLHVPCNFGPYVSGYAEGIFVHLKFIQQVFIEHQLVTLFYSSFSHVWKNGMVF